MEIESKEMKEEKEGETQKTVGESREKSLKTRIALGVFRTMSNSKKLEKMGTQKPKREKGSLQ